MQVRKEFSNKVVDLNPGEEIEITTDLGVIHEVHISAVVTSPPDGKNEKPEIPVVAHSSAGFGFSAEEVISDIGVERVSLVGIEFKKFKVRNSNEFTITASITYNSRP